MKINKLFLCFLLAAILTTVRPSAEVISWLKDTYTPFESGPLAEHKGLSPLMGAIAWHSGWIAGLHAWGTGEKTAIMPAPVVQEGREVAQKTAAEVLGRVSFKWAGSDKTTELVRTLFHDSSGDIQPTKSISDPFFKIITSTGEKLPDNLSWLLNHIKNGTIPKKPSESMVAGSKKFLELIAASRKECGEGKAYPAQVTDQIISAYYYAVQFKIHDTTPIVLFMQKAIERYIHALGVADYKPEQYPLAELASQECPTVINEFALVQTLYQKINRVNAPPLAPYISFSRATAAGGCVEAMILNFFNVILYDAEHQRYNLDLLPADTRSHISSELKTFYENVENSLVANTNKREVMESWLKAVSGLPGAVCKATPDYTKELARDHILYLKSDTHGLFELDSTPDNERLVISYLLGLKTPVANFEDLSPLISTENHYVTVSPLNTEHIFQVSINGKPLVDFIIERGHSHAEPVNQCRVRSHSMIAMPETGDMWAYLQYRLLLRNFDSLSLQNARYLLYGANTRDYDWLGQVFDKWCPAVLPEKRWAEDEPAMRSLAVKIYNSSPDMFEQIDFDCRVAISQKGDKWFGDLLVQAAKLNKLAVIDLLLEKGANINEKNSDGETALMYAMSRKDQDIIRTLLDHGADLNTKTYYGTTLLMYAMQEKMLDVVDKLLERGANINEKDSHGQTALMIAMFSENQDIIKKFLDHGVNANTKISAGITLWIYAVQHNMLDVVDKLLEKGTNINEKDSNGQTALIYAATSGSPDTVDKLLKKGANVNEKNSDGETALMYAMSRKDQDIIRTLLDHGADLNTKTYYGATLLMYAMQEKMLDVVDKLLEKNANVNEKNSNGETALMYAMSMKNQDIIKKLLDHDADVNTKTSAGTTLWIYAVQHNMLDVVDKLLTKGAAINEKDSHGQTALMYAAQRVSPDIVDKLLTKGADIKEKDSHGQTALMYAAESGSPDTVDKLLTKGADIKEKDSHGQTALMYAAERGRPDTVDKLLTKDAAINVKDSNGKTALMYAVKSYRPDTVDKLLTKGADIKEKDSHGQTALDIAKSQVDKKIIDMLEKAAARQAVVK